MAENPSTTKPSVLLERVARATSFPDEYQFVGNKTEVTRQIGNAVPIRMARALVRAALWDLAV